MYDSNMEKEAKIQELTSQVASLQSPLGRGQSGEWDVASSLEGLGFRVQDTSHRGAEGFLDLLVEPEGGQDNMRLAIEVKNRQDMKANLLETFRSNVEKGLKDNLYDAALFVSIRTHTRKSPPQSVVLEMLPDEAGRPLVPCMWVGPEKGKHQPPLTQEQLESLVCMHVALLSQCHHLRREMCSGAKEQDLALVQETFDVAGQELQEMLGDLTKQQKMMDDFRASITSLRVRCIRMCSTLFSANRDVPWLGRVPVQFPWMDVFLKAHDKSITMKDSEVWNHLSGAKNKIEKSIGKDAMFASFKQGLKRTRSTSRDSEPCDTGPDQQES